MAHIRDVLVRVQSILRRIRFWRYNAVEQWLWWVGWSQSARTHRQSTSSILWRIYRYEGSWCIKFLKNLVHLSTFLFQVFRELLQNSDDAQSKAVEIRFETGKYRENGNCGLDGPAMGKGTLPDLRVAPVGAWALYADLRFTDLHCRCTTGCLRMMVIYLEIKIGVV